MDMTISVVGCINRREILAKKKEVKKKEFVFINDTIAIHYLPYGFKKII